MTIIQIIRIYTYYLDRIQVKQKYFIGYNNLKTESMRLNTNTLFR